MFSYLSRSCGRATISGHVLRNTSSTFYKFWILHPKQDLNECSKYQWVIDWVGWFKIGNRFLWREANQRLWTTYHYQLELILERRFGEYSSCFCQAWIHPYQYFWASVWNEWTYNIQSRWIISSIEIINCLINHIYARDDR